MKEIIACSVKYEKKKACVDIIWPGQMPPTIIGEAVKSAMLKFELFSPGENTYPSLDILCDY